MWKINVFVIELMLFMKKKITLFYATILMCQVISGKKKNKIFFWESFKFIALLLMIEFYQ